MQLLKLNRQIKQLTKAINKLEEEQFPYMVIAYADQNTYIRRYCQTWDKAVYMYTKFIPKVWRVIVVDATTAEVLLECTNINKRSK